MICTHSINQNLVYLAAKTNECVHTVHIHHHNIIFDNSKMNINLSLDSLHFTNILYYLLVFSAFSVRRTYDSQMSTPRLKSSEFFFFFLN